MGISIFKYNCEKYSLKDIVGFIESQGYKVEYYNHQNRGAGYGFKVVGMEIEVRAPRLEYLKYINTDPGRWIVFGPPSIYFQPINFLYSQKVEAKESGDLELYQQRDKEYRNWHARAKKLYGQLKRRFGIKGVKTTMDAEKAVKTGEFPMGVKDLDFLKDLSGRPYTS